MRVTVLLISQHAVTIEPVLAELDEARRVMRPSGVELTGLFVSPRERALDDTTRQFAHVLGLTVDELGVPRGTLVAAVLAGLRAALDGGADVVVTLDADGQHDARQLPDLLRSHRARRSGMTIGSRWTRGGSSPGTSLVRSALSRAGNVLTKAITGARGVSDSTTSFRVYDPDVVQLLLDDELPTDAHGFFAAMGAIVQAHGYQVDEVPIAYRPRYSHESTLARTDLVRFATDLVPIRRHVTAERRAMRHNQALWAQRNPRLRAQDGAPDAEFGATEELEQLAGAERFLTWIVDELEPHLGPRVLEVGAGIGAIAVKLAERGHSVVALEPASNVHPTLAARCHAVPGVDASQLTSQQLLAGGAAGSFDSVVYVSVLEHILDDVAELRTALALLRPGGTLAIFVPAMPALYGSLDFKSGHYRRYDRTMLREVLGEAGFEPAELKYLDVAGVVPYFLMYRVLNVQRLGGGSSAVFDSIIVPASRLIQRCVAAPGFGKNLVAVARRPPETFPPDGRR